jgi:hypothetical protein
MGLSPVALYDALIKDVGHHVVEPFSVHDSDLSYKKFACSYLAKSLIRKWIPADTRTADAASYEKFTSCNKRCKDFELTFGNEMDFMLACEVRKILDEFLHPGGMPLISSYFDLISHGRPGPGVNVGANGTSLYSKYFASPLTSTSLFLYDMYRDYACWIPSFSEAEQCRYEKFGLPSIVKGSRLCFVPKTTAVSRMICIEPSLNMFYQLGLADLLERRLVSYFNIDIETQPLVNHRLSRLGSISGEFSTIDLSSASDLISLKLCEWLLPKWFFELLLTLRSHSMEYNGKAVSLNMISTMGCGFTFPLQTIIFSAILKAVANSLQISNKSPDSWSCFGDDLICKTEMFYRVNRLLSTFGFQVNPEKTFSEGWFRESCGTDWFHGQPVRPVFIKRLDRPHDFLVAINQLNEWTAYTGIMLYNTVQLLLRQVRPKFLNFVPLDSNNDAGIRIPLAFINPKLNKNQSFVYKTNERRPASLKIGEQSIHTLDGKELLYNPAGLYMSFLFGELVNCKILVRHNQVLYRSKLRCTPNWDYITANRFTNGVSLSLQQWNTAVMANL